MTAAAWVSLALLSVFAVGDWVSRARDDQRLEYVCKPAATLALLALCLAIEPADDATRVWFAVALVWSLAGDVLLMLPKDRFVAGLAAFLVAHLCYVAGFLAAGLDSGAALAWSALVTAVLVVPVAGRILAALRTGAQRALVAPVAAYVGVIATMLAVAGASGSAWAAGGAALFVGSDTMIAWNGFVRPFANASVAIMVTYHLGQLGLVLSLV